MTQVTDSSAALERALALHRQGRIEEAVAIYHSLLSVMPRNSDLFHLLGVALAQQGHFAEAAALIRYAIALDSSVLDYHRNLTKACEAAGNPDESIAAWSGLGNRLQAVNQYGGAISAYRRALAHNATHYGARSGLGAALAGLRRTDEAVAVLAGVVAGFPDRAEAHNNLGNALAGAGRLDEAVAAYREALRLNPGYADAHSNLGSALTGAGRLDEALVACREALRLKPGHADAHNNLGQALAAAGRLDQAVAAYRDALRLSGGALPVAHWNLALALLTCGMFREGWREYEWRWRWPGFPEPARPFPQPVWRGEAPDQIGGPILVTAEQGFGDTLQFCRYVPMLAARGHRVIFEVQDGLHRLLAANLDGPAVSVIPRTASPVRVHGNPVFAAHVGLMSLPERFGTELETIPAAPAYLRADPSLSAAWRGRLPRIGLVWSGRPQHPNDRNRSIAPQLLAPLGRIAGVEFVSLQKGAGEGAIPPGLSGRAIGPELGDFADTAAVLSTLDLLISVDTAVAHLAAALGVPTWVLLADVADWRWLLDRTDSPWYPSVRLFRQHPSGDWQTVIGAVADALDQTA